MEKETPEQNLVVITQLHKRTSMRDVLKRIIIWLANPANLIHVVKHIIVSLPRYTRSAFAFITFFIVLVHFSISRVYEGLTRIPLIGRVFLLLGNTVGKIISAPINRIIQKLESVRPFQVRQSYLIYLAFQNLQVRKSRTLVTMLGMSVGVGIIVYLLSLGYGIERLVISQVASLNELKIIDVTSGKSSNRRIDDKIMKKISQDKKIEKVIPLISLVGRVNFKKARTDIMIHGITQDYIDTVQIKPISGKTFSMKNNNYSADSGIDNSMVKGLSSELKNGVIGQPIMNNVVEFNILPGTAAPVRETCDIFGNQIGYTTRVEGGLNGKEVWGSKYISQEENGRSGYDEKNDIYLGEWMYAKYPIFTKDSEEKLTPDIDDNGHQTWKFGCVRRIDVHDVQLVKTVLPQGAQVLGQATASASLTTTPSPTDAASTSSASLQSLLQTEGVVATGSAQPQFTTEVISTDSAGVEFVRLVTASSSASIKEKEKKLKFENKPSGEAIVSTGLMKLLGLNEKNIIGKEFTMQFIVVKTLRPDIDGRQLSDEVKYKVVGLVKNEQEQFFYVPFRDLLNLGVQNYSQMKVLIRDKDSLNDIRVQIEELGYSTSSSADTVAQIESLFRSLRLVLASIGLIALIVASLGMFNTLTVSLLERTREIGGMKVIGMVSEEVQDLFLGEAMIMGFSGGIGGIIIGYLLGQTTSLLISIFSLSRGYGYLQVSYIPFTFIIFILLLSFIVGIVTGMYPARRAKNTSALNALRYE